MTASQLCVLPAAWDRLPDSKSSSKRLGCSSAMPTCSSWRCCCPGTRAALGVGCTGKTPGHNPGWGLRCLLGSGQKGALRHPRGGAVLFKDLLILACKR